MTDDAFPPLVNPTPWDKDSLQACPEDETRNILDDGYTQKVKWPFTGATCALQVTDDVTLVMLGSDTAPTVGAPNLDHLEHCPDFNERYTMRNGTDMAIPYPKAGFNCNWSLAQGPWPANVAPANIPVPATSAYPAGLEHCPDRPERQTLRNGTVRAVPFPKAGYNCVPDMYPGVAGVPWPYALAQGQATPWPANVVAPNIPVGADAAYPAGLEHCPDRPERETLRNGTTKAVPFPTAGYNCVADAYPGVAGTPWPYALAQATPWPANVAPANIPVPAASAYPAGLEHCPDRPERETLRNGTTKAVAFPAKGYNCMPDAYPAVAGVPWPYALAQATPWPANVAPANISAGAAVYPAGLEHCPDLPERQTLRDGLTKPIPFPAAGANCKADIYPGKEGVPAPYH